MDTLLEEKKALNYTVLTSTCEAPLTRRKLENERRGRNPKQIQESRLYTKKQKREQVIKVYSLSLLV